LHVNDIQLKKVHFLPSHNQIHTKCNISITIGYTKYFVIERLLRVFFKKLFSWSKHVGTLVKSSEKHNIRTSVCDLKISHIGEPPQLVSVYIREERPLRMCPWGAHFCERVNAYKNIYITRAAPPSGGLALGLWVK